MKYLLLLLTFETLQLSAATVTLFKDVTSTNLVKTNDLILVDSALGGTNYLTRTATISTLISYPRITNAMSWSGDTNLVIGGDGREFPMPGAKDAIVNVRNAPWNATGNGIADDAPAIQAALNYAWGTNNLRTDLNKTVYIPPGTYNLGTTLSVTNVRSAILMGGGKNATILRSTHAGPAFQTDGLWYSSISGLQFYATLGHTNAVFELDGNKAQDGSTIGVQGNTFKDCEFVGSMVAANGLAICSVGAGYGQGSENLFLNCHFLQCTNAAFISFSPNALNNTLLGGNVQSCRHNGIDIEYGSASVISMGFQNADAGLLSQSGYDIVFVNYGNAANSVYNCRSESVFYINSQSPPLECSGFIGNPPVGAWASTNSYTTNDVITPNTVNGYLFQCTQSGVSDVTEPVWDLAGGSVTDGSAKWVRFSPSAVRMQQGSLRNSWFYYANTYLGVSQTYIENCYFGPADWLNIGQFLDTGGPVLIGNTCGSPYSIHVNASTASVVTNSVMMNLGLSPLLLSNGSSSSGATYGDVGIWRNDGSATSGDAASDSHNVLGIIGSIGKLKSTNATGDDTVIVAGLGATNSGNIRLMTQPVGSTNALTQLNITPSGIYGLSNSIDVINGTNAQTIHLYSTKTDASNFGRLTLRSVAGDPIIGIDGAGSGIGHWLGFATEGTVRWWLATGGTFEAGSDNSYDIGTAGGARPRTVYAGTGFSAVGALGITTTWTNMIPGVITQRISTVGGIVVTNLTL